MHIAYRVFSIFFTALQEKSRDYLKNIRITQVRMLESEQTICIRKQAYKI